MAWNPDTYNKFKSERFAPFDDLLALLKPRPGIEVIDLGCGTGELTTRLAGALRGAKVLGIDSSTDMLRGSAAFTNEQVRFECRSIEDELGSGRKWDLVFSNAAIQWVENHQVLLPRIISTIKTNGQLLIQLPAQHHNVTNRLLDTLASEAPFHELLQGWNRISPVLEIDDYARILFDNGSRSMTVYEKVYPLVLPDAGALFDWVSGTALLPYIERLQQGMRQQFIDEYKGILQVQFAQSPVFYPFKRIIMEASF
jgi:trans-aconitate 2-methyltransferase